MSAFEQYQSSTASTPVEQHGFRQREWSRPNLHINNIAVITEGGLSSSGVDNCTLIDGLRCDP